MLGRGHQRARRISQNGREFSGGDGANVSADFALAPPLKARADESDPGTSVSGMQRQCDGQARVNPNAAQYGLIAKRRLPADFHTPRPTYSHATPRHATPSDHDTAAFTHQLGIET